MTKIVLLRHGESIWNKENLFTGWTDVDLSDSSRRDEHLGPRSGRARSARGRRGGLGRRAQVDLRPDG